MKPKAELMARLRARRQKEGLVRLEFWVPAEYAAKIRAYVARLTRRADGNAND
jgi:hypothetical protein